MQNNWQTKKLGELCDFQNGFAFKSNLFKESGLPVLRISNIQNDGISYNRLVFFDKESYKENFDKYQASRGDLVIAMSGATTGKLAICDADEVFYLNQRVGKFIPKKDLSKDYLYYFLSARIEENLKISAGSAQPNLSTEQIKSLEIPLPPLPEQRHIVKILDEVFEKIAKAKENAEKNLKNAKELFESYLQSVFANPEKDWEEKKLGDLCEVITKGTTPTSVGYKFVEEGINFIKIESITPDGKFLPNKFGAITEECHKALKRSQLKKGDILFSIAGALGRTAFVDEDILPANINQALAIIRLKLVNNVLSKFVLLSLNSGLTSGQISKFKGGVAQQNLSLEQLKSFQIPLPLLSEQESIVEKLDALSAETKKLEAIYKQKLADLEELKKSVLKKAFSGEL